MNSSKSQGLCMTCNHAGGCVYLANAVSTVWRCEEFDDGPVMATVKKIIDQADKPGTAAEPLAVHGAYARTA